jgi:hypothetical protein
MSLSPKLIGPAISSITGLISSTSMLFVGLGLNYGFPTPISPCAG